ncbi:MAG: hypothetical protein A2352_11705 [Caulobacterales bacterium RIFOXYB1_FULL_67_16]|nr:MAG: hypothetical protein A2352_11705 [Caulobacterales bacterium RIFOXYB1_FULL_67_16]
MSRVAVLALARLDQRIAFKPQYVPNLPYVAISPVAVFCGEQINFVDSFRYEFSNFAVTDRAIGSSKNPVDEVIHGGIEGGGVLRQIGARIARQQVRLEFVLRAKFDQLSAVVVGQAMRLISNCSLACQQ